MADFEDNDEGDEVCYKYEYNSEEIEEQDEGDTRYEYTDFIDEPVLEREISDSHVHIPEGYCNIVNYREILPIMEKLIRETSCLIGQTEDTAQLLLQNHRWSFEFVAERYFANADSALKNAGVISTDFFDGKNRTCLICFDEVDDDGMFGLSCGHKFCRGYIESQVSDGRSCVSMSCAAPHCKLHVAASVVRALCPGYTTESYMKYLTRNFIERSSYMTWCPAPGCECVAMGSGVTDITCSCYTAFCKNCGQESHQPNSCTDITKWEEKNKSESGNAHWILVNTKSCPGCSSRIEKNQGCNHMTCSNCRYEFCWICMENWADHGGSFFNCHKLKTNSETDPKLQSAKIVLDRYIHYYTRYHNHDRACKHAVKNRQAIKDKISEQLQQDTEIGGTDLSYLAMAIEQLIECRRVLKNSYVRAYFLQDGTPAKQLYEFQQQMLEVNTEELSRLTEKTLSTISEEEAIHIVNLTRSTRRLVEAVLTSASDDMPRYVEVVTTMDECFSSSALSSTHHAKRFQGR